MNQHSNIKSAIAYDDLREWLSMAERLGEVRNVSGATWQEDIGLAAEAVLRAETGPCVVFDDIAGSPKGFRVLLNMFAGTRRNMTLGFPDHLTKWELSDAYREAYLAEPKIIPHEIVEDGPVLENVITGDEIDVTKFPAPIWHEKDGGRYIGTGDLVIMRDPETYEKFENLILTHTCRSVAELQYGFECVEETKNDPLIGELAQEHLLHFASTTREASANQGRITQLMQDRSFFKALNLEFLDPAHDRIMLCGSMAMIKDVKSIIEPLGFIEGSNHQPGSFVIERAFVG